MHALFVELRSQPHHAAALQQLLEELVRHARSEAGTLAYTLHQDAGRPGDFFLYELYKDQQAFERHMAAAPVQAALRRFDALLAEPPRVVACRPISSAASA